MKRKLAIGLMSGTSADGVDAALVEIEGSGIETKVTPVEFISIPYSAEVRNNLLKLAKGVEGGTREISRMNFLLGKLMAEASLSLIEKAGKKPSDIDFVGSHGHTFYHEPVAVDYCGRKVRSTLQLGESAIISQALGCPVVSDFRVSDMAAGGEGAPLVPYTEFILYGNKGVDYGLLNIGGIGNITFIGKDYSLSDVFAFDTGPGNMVIDQVVSRFSEGRNTYDNGGEWGEKGKVDDALMEYLLLDPYLERKPPKTTGREFYGEEYVDKLLKKAEGLKEEDIIRTVTAFTAECVKRGIDDFFPRKPEVILVGGGGAMNSTLMKELSERIGVKVEKNPLSDAKEAIAFALLANERLEGICNNAPKATGAKHPVVMGKVVL